MNKKKKKGQIVGKLSNAIAIFQYKDEVKLHFLKTVYCIKYWTIIKNQYKRLNTLYLPWLLIIYP